jgi:hypothetical protein
MYRYDRHFTIDEARQVLKEILPLIREMSALKAALDDKGFYLSEDPEKVVPEPSTNGHKPLPEEFIRLTYILNSLLESGILIREMGRGLIDFPHLRASGEEVYLCWRLGEKTIAHWHHLEDGFAGRQSIDTL